MRWRRHLLWIDGLAAAAGGAVVLLAGDWLSALYRLPAEFLTRLGWVNLAYAAYSLSLAARRERPLRLIALLAVANGLWALACGRWAFAFADMASGFGLAHLLGEGVFVGALAALEWRWRESLRKRGESSGPRLGARG
jgi:hypothetical protein